MKKKQTQIAKARQLWSQDPNMSAKEMAEKLKLPINRVYVLRNQARKRMGRDAFDQVVDIKQKHNDKKYVSDLEAENKKLTEWTQLWRQKYLKLEDDYTRAKVMYLDSQAVVKYLEAKLAKLLKGENNE